MKQTANNLVAAGDDGSKSATSKTVDLSKVKRKNSSSQAQQRLKKVKEMLVAKRLQEKNQKLASAESDNNTGADASQKQNQRQQQQHQNKSQSQIKNPTQKLSLTPPNKLSALQQKMQQKLKGARFRWINEALYTTTGDKAFEMVQGDPSIFEEYHQGFTAQVEKWPVNPVDMFIKQLQARDPLVVADMGCGEARLAATVGAVHTVHSFDLVAYNDLITPCNVADVPLADGTADIVIFCLALMGTDFLKFIREANRILRTGGELKIAEVVSRVSDV
ncbi:25S rRNA (adenine645-N1)-methyltransferase, partial [Kickxella alabastrina]